MLIEQDLPQFNEERALIITTGTQESEIYYASQGELTEVKNIFVPQPKPADLDGHFESSGGGQILQAGSAFEPSDIEEKTETLFVRELSEQVTQLVQEKNISSIYLFTPEHFKNAVKESFPKEVQDKVRKTFMGIYTKQHPFVLIKKIKDAFPEQHFVDLSPHEDEAQKILRKKRE